MEKTNYQLSGTDFDLIGHSLGINTYGARLSKRKKDKKLPKEYYRNYFQVGEGSDSYETFLNLEANGIVSKRLQFGQTVFHVTEEGKEAFKVKFTEEITNQ